MNFLQYLNLDGENRLKVLGMVFLGYLTLIFSRGFQYPLVLYLKFFLALFCAILTPGYIVSEIVLGRDRLVRLAKIGVFYLSLIWGSIIVIFEAIIMSLVTTLSLINFFIVNWSFSLLLMGLVFRTSKWIKIERIASLEISDTRQQNVRKSDPFLYRILVLILIVIFVVKARFLIYAIFNNAYLGGLDDPAFHINYALEIVQKNNVLAAFRERPFGLKYPFGFHSLIAILSILSDLPVLESTRIMFFLYYTLAPVGIYLIIRTILSERQAVYSLLFWAFHQSVEIGWIFLNSGLFGRILAYQFIFLILLLILIRGKYLLMLIALAAAFLTHFTAVIFVSVTLLFFFVRMIRGLFWREWPMCKPKIGFSPISVKDGRISLWFKVLIEGSIVILSLAFIVLSMNWFYSDVVVYILSKLNVTSSFQDWPRISAIQTMPNVFSKALNQITNFIIYALSGIIPIVFLAIVGIYELFRNQRLKKSLEPFDGLILCWFVLLTGIGLIFSQNPFVERIWGEVAVPLGFLAMRSFPRIEQSLANRIKRGQHAEKVFVYGFCPILILLNFHPGVSPIILTGIPSSNSELFSFFKMVGLSYLKHIIMFILLIYAFYRLLIKTRPYQITREQIHTLTLIFILTLVGSTLASNIEFLPPDEVRFKSSDLQAAELLVLNNSPSQTIVYAHALHPTTLWLAYYLHDYEIKTFVSIFNAGDFEQWVNGLPYGWNGGSPKGSVSMSPDSFNGETSLNLTSNDKTPVTVSHELLIRSRRQDFFRNDLDNITMSIWVKPITETNAAIPFIRIESAIEGIEESVSLLLITNTLDKSSLSENETYSQIMPVTRGSWTQISLNLSRYWSETYHTVLPARMRIILGINAHGEAKTPTNLLLDNFSFNSEEGNIEQPLWPLLQDNGRNTALTQYIFLGSNTTINLPYGYIPYVSREFFTEPVFKRIFQDGTSEIYQYTGKSKNISLSSRN